MTLQNEMDKEMCLYIGSILHDIGKIRQRYEKNQSHSYYGSLFINELTNLNDGERKNLIKKLVANHHESSRTRANMTEEEWGLLGILKMADRVSASHDRNDHDPEYTPLAGERGDHMKKIFSSIIPPENHNSKENIHKHSAQNYVDYFRLMTLETLSKAKKELSKPIDFRDSEFDLKKLYDDLLQGINSISLQNSDYRSWSNFFNSLDSVLMNYLSFVPSAFYYDPPNITLYDHLKLTASLSNVIYKSQPPDKNAKILFIMGNASGIQKYIFNRSVSESVDDKATKRLRGRSFYVRLYTEAIVKRILDGLSLYRFNVIMQKTDGFIIMAPYSEENVNKIKEIRGDIELFSEKSRRGLRTSIGWTSSYVRDLENDAEPTSAQESVNRFSQVLETLSNVVSKRKMQYASHNNEEFYDIIRPEKTPFSFYCRKCGRTQVNKRDKTCKYCENEEWFGEKLPKSAESYIVGKEKQEPTENNHFLEFSFGNWNYTYSIVGVIDPDSDDEVICVNQLNVNNRRNFRLIFQGLYSLTNDKGVVPINDSLCLIRQNGRDYKYLAMNKSDVDNMGMLINYGMPNLTISKYASISLLLTAFFALFSNILAEQHKVYILYAGGDDVTAIGDDQNIIEFSFNFQEAFDEWVMGKMTLSTGVDIVNHKFPVLKLVDLSEEQLTRSKENNKDSISIIDIVATWDKAKKQFETSRKIYDVTFGEGIEAGFNGTLGRTFCNYLLEVQRHSILTQTPEKGKRLVYPDYMISYYVRRNWKMKDKLATDHRERFIKEILEEDTMDKIDMAATLAILKGRWK